MGRRGYVQSRHAEHDQSVCLSDYAQATAVDYLEKRGVNVHTGDSSGMSDPECSGHLEIEIPILKHTGFYVEGTAQVLLWNGNVAETVMDAFHAGSLDDIPKNVNDGQLGCQRILSAKCLVYKDYEGKAYRFYGVTDYEGDELSVAKRGV